MYFNNPDNVIFDDDQMVSLPYDNHDKHNDDYNYNHDNHNYNHDNHILMIIKMIIMIIMVHVH